MHGTSCCVLTLALGLLGISSGCATVTRGTTQAIHINSSPTGAAVNIDGSQRGVTPFSIELARSRDHNLKFSKKGYLDATFTVRRKFSGSSLTGNILLGGLPGMAVDALSGAAYDLKPETVLVTLKPQEKVVAATPSEKDEGVLITDLIPEE